MRLHTKAGLSYLVPLVGVLVVWYFLLFEGNAPGVASNRTFAFLLSEGPRPWWFRWLFALPMGCVALAAGYFSRLATTRTGAAVLLALGIALAIASWLTVSPEVAILATLPLFYAALSAAEAFGLRPL
jgi:hypothetical protein